MASNSTNKSNQTPKVLEPEENTPVKVVPEDKTPVKVVPKEIDMTQYVTVRNGFQGRLFYKSSKTGERFVWSNFGDEQEMELRELRNARNSKKQFFTNNWFMFDEDWIVDFLGVKQYYKNAVSIQDFDNIFSKKPDEIKKMIAGMTDGQKRSLAYRAKQLMSEEKIDSMKTISTLEESLGIELIDKEK